MGFYETKESLREGEHGSYLGMQSFLVSPFWGHRREPGLSLISAFGELRAQVTFQVVGQNKVPDIQLGSKITWDALHSLKMGFRENLPKKLDQFYSSL